MRFLPQLAILCWLAAFAGAQPALPSQSPTVSEYQLKAAFVFNFVKFVEWPGETFRSPSEPILICVVGHSDIATALEEAVKGKMAAERRILIQPGYLSGPGCHIIFVPKNCKFRRMSEEIRTGPFLTVGEDETFTAEGGIVSLKLTGGRVHLEVNLNAAERAHLRISSKLLSLASVVRK